MCFNQTASFALSGLGIAMMIWAWNKTKNRLLVTGIFYFFLMEFLQGWQYFWIGDCESWMNKFLTFLGVIHICYQPYFSNLMLHSSISKEKEYGQYMCSLYTFRLAFVGGTFLAIRGLLANISPETFVHDDTSGMGVECYENGYPTGCPDAGPLSTEWIRGKGVCTYNGVHHLAWSYPLASPSYYLPSAFIHFFLMFAPYFTILPFSQKKKWLSGIILFATGPLLAALITPNLQEQASIWCFFSMAQILINCCTIYFNGEKYYRGDKKKD